MKLVVLTVVVVLSMLAVDTCNGETPESLTCDELPKREIPNIELLVKNSPYTYDYALTKDMDCTTKVFTKPARGITNYNGAAMIVRGSSVIVYEYSVRSDNHSVDVTPCSTGKTDIWYTSALQFDENGGFLCLHLCNNTALTQFKCFSNNNATSPKELEAVDLAKKVPNGDKIHDARTECPAHKGCNVF